MTEQHENLERHGDGEDRCPSEMIPCGTLCTTVCLAPQVPDSLDGGALNWMCRVGPSLWSLPRSPHASILLEASPGALLRTCLMPPWGQAWTSPWNLANSPPPSSSRCAFCARYASAR